MRILGKKKWEALEAVLDSASKVVDSREHTNVLQGLVGPRCVVCNERFPCLQAELTKALAVWKKINA